MSKAPKSGDPGMKKGTIFEDVIGKDDGPTKEVGKRDGLSKQSPGADFPRIRPEKGGTCHVRACDASCASRGRKP